MTFGKPIEWYTPEEAIRALADAPRKRAAEYLFSLLNPDTKAALRRAVHRLKGEQAS